MREGSTAEPAARRANAAAHYTVLAAAFVGALLISNVVAVKPLSFGALEFGALRLPLIFDGGVFLFPLCYILGDVLTEVYGWRAARRTIFTAFVLALLASAVIFAVQLSPPAPGWPHQEAFSAVLGFVPRIVAASLLAFLAGQLLNAWVLDRLRRRDGARFLRLRLMLSSVVGELIDTLLFCTVAFAGIITGMDFVMYVALGYAVKVLAEVLLLPLTTRIIAWVRRVEG